MIKRHVFEKMMERFDIGYVSFEDGKDTQYYAFFDCCIKNNRYVSKDWFFCDRWTNMGGKIYVVPDITKLIIIINMYSRDIISACW